MVAWRSPKGIILISVIGVLLAMFFLFALDIKITSGALFTGLLFLGFGGVVLWLLLHQRKQKDDMMEAIKVIRPKWREWTQEELRMRNSGGNIRYFPPDSTKFIGFILKRTGGERAGKFMSIIVAKRSDTFDIHDFRELTEDEEIKNDPFVIMRLPYRGSPVPMAPSEMMTWMPPMKGQGTVVNVDRPRQYQDSWEEERT